MTNVKPATDERVERWRAVLNHRPCSDPNACDWCQLLARIDADREELSNLRQAKFWWVEQEAQLRAQIAAVKAEVERLKASVRLACSDDTERAARLIRMAESGNTVKPADDSGTGRAR